MRLKQIILNYLLNAPVCYKVDRTHRHYYNLESGYYAPKHLNFIHTSFLTRGRSYRLVLFFVVIVCQQRSQVGPRHKNSGLAYRPERDFITR